MTKLKFEPRAPETHPKRWKAEAIKSLKPNIIVKGGEWTAEEVRERDEIPENIEVFVYPFKEGYSSTNIIKMIKER